MSRLNQYYIHIVSILRSTVKPGNLTYLIPLTATFLEPMRDKQLFWGLAFRQE